MTTLRRAFFTVLLLLGGGTCAAQPAVYESNFGPALAPLTGCDDCTTMVTLSFPFPFAGTNYTTVFVGTNGDIQLGGLGTDGDIDYDHWIYFEEFVSDALPSIAVFNTDLDLGTTGTVHFNDFGNRAVFTWNEVGTNQDLTALITVQLQIYSDGRITFAYNGVLDGPTEDLIADLDQGIVVGITRGLQPAMTSLPTSDLSTQFTTASTEIYERWCYDTANSCGYGGSNAGLSGPVNTAFDLDFRNVFFTPAPGGGFVVNTGTTFAQSVPTLSQLGLGLLALALVALVAWQARRQHG